MVGMSSAALCGGQVTDQAEFDEWLSTLHGDFAAPMVKIDKPAAKIGTEEHGEVITADEATDYARSMITKALEGERAHFEERLLQNAATTTKPASPYTAPATPRHMLPPTTPAPNTALSSLRAANTPPLGGTTVEAADEILNGMQWYQDALAGITEAHPTRTRLISHVIDNIRHFGGGLTAQDILLGALITRYCAPIVVPAIPALIRVLLHRLRAATNGLTREVKIRLGMVITKMAAVAKGLIDKRALG